MSSHLEVGEKTLCLELFRSLNLDTFGPTLTAPIKENKERTLVIGLKVLGNIHSSTYITTIHNFNNHIIRLLTNNYWSPEK